MLNLNQIVTITKYKFGKIRPFSYQGRVVEGTPERVVIEAFFNVNDKVFPGIVLRKGDCFIETYYSKRWYNIFEIYDVDSGLLKGWYCNIAQPAVFELDGIWFIDMELDLLVYPDRTWLVLDEDEFNTAHMPDELRREALLALEALKKLNFSEKEY
jgi:uncharacterized protein